MKDEQNSDEIEDFRDEIREISQKLDRLDEIYSQIDPNQGKSPLVQEYEEVVDSLEIIQQVEDQISPADMEEEAFAEFFSGYNEIFSSPARDNNRIKKSMEVLISHPAYSKPLKRLDTILGKQERTLNFHIQGEKYAQLSKGKIKKPEPLELRITNNLNYVRNIQHPFFQQIDQERTLYDVKEAPIALEINRPFDQTTPVKSNLKYIDVEAPSLESHLEDSIIRLYEDIKNLEEAYA